MTNLNALLIKSLNKSVDALKTVTEQNEKIFQKLVPAIDTLNHSLERIVKVKKPEEMPDNPLQEDPTNPLLKRISGSIALTNKILIGISAAFAFTKALEKTPSILGGVVKLLDFGFMYLLKPLADLLAMILLPIAVNVIKLAGWIQDQPEWFKKIVGGLELVAAVMLGLVAKFGIGGLSKAAGKLGSIAEGTLGKIGVDGLKASLGNIVEWFEKKVVPKLEWAFEKSGLKTVWDWIARSITKDAEGIVNFFGPTFRNIAARITAWLEESRIGRALLAIGEKIGVWLEESGISKIFTRIGEYLSEKGLLGILITCGEVLGKFFKITLIADIIAAITGWLSDLVGPNNPLKHLLLFVADLSNMVSRMLDVVGWVIDAFRDVWAALNGDFSFKNLNARLTAICSDFANVFLDTYNVLATLINKYLGTNIQKATRLNEQGTTGGTYSGIGYNENGTDVNSLIPSNNDSSSSSSGRSSNNNSVDYNKANSDYSKQNMTPNGDGTNTIHMFATGGIVTAPTLGMVGEAGPEAIIPLDQMPNMGGNVTITVNGILDKSELKSMIGDIVDTKLNKHTRVTGSVW
ncbi:MAG TPA: hypothetical protein VGK06_15475 [Methanosarcina sp.]|jgi:hypothetical protein